MRASVAVLALVACLAMYGCGGSDIADPFSVTCAEIDNDPELEAKLADALLDRVNVAGDRASATGNLQAQIVIACSDSPDESPGKSAVNAYRQDHPG